MHLGKKMDVSNLRPTSKVSLKLSCLEACNNDLKTASELYDFIAGGLDLPDTDPVSPSIIGQIRQGAGEVFGWVQEHRDELIEGYQFLKGLKTGSPSAPPVPPIPMP